MKKFGTPIAAAPGSLTEKVGLSTVGEPSVFWVGWAGSGVGVVAGVSASSFAGLSTLPSSDSAFGSSVLGSVWFGCFPLPGFLVVPLSPRAGVDVGPGVLVAPGVGEGSSPTFGVLVGDGVCVGVAVSSGVAVAVGVGVGVSTGPRSVIVSTGAGRPGIVIDSADWPDGTSTVSVSTWPSVSVTVTRCSSAAAGTLRRPNVAAAASVMKSFRRLILGAVASPPRWPRRMAPPSSPGGMAARYRLDYGSRNSATLKRAVSGEVPVMKAQVEVEVNGWHGHCARLR